MCTSGECLTVARVGNPDYQRRAAMQFEDARKIHARTAVVFATLSDFDLWITTRGIPARLMRKYRKLTKINVVEKEPVNDQ